MTLPKTTDGFEWTQEGWGPALRCTAIAAPHLFSTRGLPLSPQNGRPAAGWLQLAAALGVAPAGILRPKQVHGDTVTVVAEGQAAQIDPDDICSAAADIIMTSRPDVAVAVQAADCVPLLLFDPETGAVAAAHAGWRGTAARVAETAVRRMHRQFGTRPEALIAAIGPSIGPCCYEVGDELLAAFGPDGRRWFYRVATGLMLNLWAANRDQLVESGVNTAHVHAAEFCTVMHPELFDSYRRDGRQAGRLAAAIRTARGTTP